MPPFDVMRPLLVNTPTMCCPATVFVVRFFGGHDAQPIVDRAAAPQLRAACAMVSPHWLAAHAEEWHELRHEPGAPRQRLAATRRHYRYERGVRTDNGVAWFRRVVPNAPGEVLHLTPHDEWFRGIFWRGGAGQTIFGDHRTLSPRSGWSPNYVGRMFVMVREPSSCAAR